MRVVVTRPEVSGQKTAALLHERGHDPVLLPLTMPVHFAPAAIEALAKDFSALAVTSAEAISVLVKCGIDAPAILGKPLFTVGEASADAAHKAGFQNVVPGKSDGAALAQLMFEAMQPSVSGRPVVYLAGKPREAGFEHRLSSLNVPFETVEVYEMQPVQWQRTQLEERLTSPPIRAVLFYSAEAARRFFTLVTHENLLDRLGDCSFICISDKVLSAIPEAFQHAAWASATPSQSEMFDLLDRKAGT